MHLIVQEVPEQPKSLNINSKQSRSIQITWIQPFSGNSPIEEYNIQYKPIVDTWQTAERITVLGTQSVINIDGLHPATAYHIRIAAENKLGSSDYSETVQVTTLEEVPSGPPLNVRGEAKGSTEILLTWEPPNKNEWNGNLLGYYVGYQTATDQVGPTQGFNLKTVEVRSHFGFETILENLNKFTPYNIFVQAYTSQGSGPPSKEIQVTTLEDGQYMRFILLIIILNDNDIYKICKR